ncbi:hypothetical protein JOM56_002612 [Amanita muscaria]
MSITSTFLPVYAQGDPGNGIAGYDLKSTRDRSFAFDYDSSSKLDHIVLYRPGTGTIWIIRNQGDNFSTVYQQGDPGTGIGGYDLKYTADRAFAFDYDSSGKQDHIVLYRPGFGTIWILSNRGGQFSPVYAQGNGIGGYDLESSADVVFPFDYKGTGNLDHLVLYRPGSGAIWILNHNGILFAPVYQGGGIGGYDLESANDRAFAFDYDSSGKLDHLALYRPGKGDGIGIGGYDLESTADLAFTFDYDKSGKLDHLVLWHGNGHFAPVYKQGDPGVGIGGYDLKSPADLVYAFDYNKTGNQDHLVLYRPGTGTILLLKRK